MSPGIDASRRAQLRRALEARAQRLSEEIRAALHSGGSEAALPNHRDEVDDEAVADLEASLDIAAVQRDARELQEVLAARERLAGTGFGECTDCGGPIAWERLAALPHAARCVACETLAEQKARRPSAFL